MIKKLRGYLLTGLFFWLPILVTVIVISFLFDWLNNVAEFLPAQYRPAGILGYTIPGFTLLLAILLFLLTGVLVTNWLGQKLVGYGEAILERIPLVRVIYQTTKQIIQAFFMSSGKSFRQVVMIEYPRQGVWTLAFLTGELQAKNNPQPNCDRLCSVYIPTTPNPTSGFFVLLRREEVFLVDMSVEQALKMILSLGAIKHPLAILNQ